MNLKGLKKDMLNNYYFKKIKNNYTNGNVTFISSNCLGSKLYQILNMQYNSPFIGLYLYAPDFIDLLSNLDDCLNSKLKFTDNSKYKKVNLENDSYPIGLLNDEIELHFIHYHNENIARDNWYRRLSRVDWDNLFIIFTDRDQCTYKHLVKFNDLPFKKKVCFTSKNYSELDSCVYLPEYKHDQSVGILTYNFYITCYHFDWINWLNNTA